jgi:serine/threonine protein phosphatase PrpC
MLIKEELIKRERHASKSIAKQKKDLLPINLHIVENKKMYESLNMMKTGKIINPGNSGGVKIFKEEYSTGSSNQLGSQGNSLSYIPLYNGSIKNLNQTNSKLSFGNSKITTKTGFNSKGFAKDILNKGKHERTLSHNEGNNKMIRSLSPLTDGKKLLEKSLSPLRASKPNHENARLTIVGNNNMANMMQSLSESYNSKTNTYNFNNAMRSTISSSFNGMSNGNGNQFNVSNVSNNNYFKNSSEREKEAAEKKLLPNLKVTGRKGEDLTPNRYNNENSNSQNSLNLHSGSSHKPQISNSQHSSLKIKKDIEKNYLDKREKEKEREITPNRKIPTRNDNGSNGNSPSLVQNANNFNSLGSTNKYFFNSNSNSNLNLNGNSNMSGNTNQSSANFAKKTFSDLKNLNFSNGVNPLYEDSEREMGNLTSRKPNMINKYSSKSKQGMSFDGNYKTNQDSFLIKTKIFDLNNYAVFGVFDGHGMHGHFVSNLIKIFFADYYSKPELFVNNKEKIAQAESHHKRSVSTIQGGKNNQLNYNYLGIREDKIYEKLKEKNYQIIKSAFFQAENALSQSKYETNFSGATSVVVIIVDDKIICANAGDSRAILVVEDESEGGKVIPLSRDHKPEIKEESQRIVRCGGRVDKFCENGIKSGPYRVWLKHENFPGLAMSRSVGDFVAESVGVICDPGKNFYLKFTF